MARDPPLRQNGKLAALPNGSSDGTVASQVRVAKQFYGARDSPETSHYTAATFGKQKLTGQGRNNNGPSLPAALKRSPYFIANPRKTLGCFIE